MKILVRISLSISPSEGSIDILTKAATEMKIMGRVEPSIRIPIEIRINHPDGSIESKTVQSSANGQFSLSFTPRASGLCRIEAQFAGNEQYESSQYETKVNIYQNYNTALAIVVLVVGVSVGSVVLLRKGRRVKAYDLSLTALNSSNGLPVSSARVFLDGVYRGETDASSRLSIRNAP